MNLPKRIKVPQRISRLAAIRGVTPTRAYQIALEEKGRCRSCTEELLDGHLPPSDRLSALCGHCLYRKREQQRQRRGYGERHSYSKSYTEAVMSVPAPPPKGDLDAAILAARIKQLGKKKPKSRRKGSQ